MYTVYILYPYSAGVDKGVNLGGIKQILELDNLHILYI